MINMNKKLKTISLIIITLLILVSCDQNVDERNINEEISFDN